MKKLNNLRLERINSKVFRHENERFLDFGNNRHKLFYTKWKVLFRQLKEEFTFKKDWFRTNPFAFASDIKELQTSINGEFLFTFHHHYRTPYKEYDIRGILFETVEHKALFILKYGDVMENKTNMF
jgi:hypothetical protein